jgi:hypothetical protein
MGSVPILDPYFRLNGFLGVKEFEIRLDSYFPQLSRNSKPKFNALISSLKLIKLNSLCSGHQNV